MDIKDLHPCNACGGPVGGLFYVLSYSIAVVKVHEVNQLLGLQQMLGGGPQAGAIAAVMAPSTDVVEVAMDSPEHRTLMIERFLCSDCYLKPITLALLTETSEVDEDSGG